MDEAIAERAKLKDIFADMDNELAELDKLLDGL